MDNYRIDPRKQFSKRLARWTAVFWFFYMTWLSVIFILSPDAALYSVYMGIIVTIVMVINVISYTKNSIAEKMAFTLLDKIKLELKLNNNKGTKEDDKDSAEESCEISDEEGGGNG